METSNKRWLVWLGGTVLAAVAIFGFGPRPVHAADLGGSCCADLEERVSEIEATYAKKGNRKVSLEVTGSLSEAILYTDPTELGGKKDTAVVGNNNIPNSIKFRGKATINPDLYAGYVLELGVGHTEANFTITGYTGITDDNAINVRQSYAYVGSKQLGSVRLGTTEDAAYGATNASVANTLVASKMLTLGPVEGVRVSFGGTTLSIPLEPFEGNITQGVRYDSRTWEGFTLSASWQTNSSYAVGLYYSGEPVKEFKVTGAVAYERNANDEITAALSPLGFPAVESEKVLMSAGIEHIPSGLFVQGAYGRLGGQLATGLFGGNTNAWEVQAGDEFKLIPLGKTTVYAEYADWSDATLKFWGGGVVQHIDNAAMDLYASGRDVQLFNTDSTEFMGGVRISF